MEGNRKGLVNNCMWVHGISISKNLCFQNLNEIGQSLLQISSSIEQKPITLKNDIMTKYFLSIRGNLKPSWPTWHSFPHQPWQQECSCALGWVIHQMMFSWVHHPLCQRVRGLSTKLCVSIIRSYIMVTINQRLVYNRPSLHIANYTAFHVLPMLQLTCV